MFKGKKSKKSKDKEIKKEINTWRGAMELNYPEFKEYYEANKSKVDDKNDPDVFGPLQLACASNKFKVVKLLLEDENVDPQLKRTPYVDPIIVMMLWGVQSGSKKATKIFEYLLEHPRVDVNALDNSGKTPFQRACSLNHKPIIEKFISNPRVNLSVLDHGQSPMFQACANGWIATFEALIECDKIEVELPEPETNATPFYIACEKGHLGPVQTLIKHPKVNVNIMNIFSSTPLYVACQNGMTEIVKVLLDDERVDISLSRINGMTPFMISCFYGHNSIVELFLSSGRDLQINKIVDGKTALDLAKEKGHTETVELLQTYLNSK